MVNRRHGIGCQRNRVLVGARHSPLAVVASHFRDGAAIASTSTNVFAPPSQPAVAPRSAMPPALYCRRHCHTTGGRSSPPPSVLMSGGPKAAVRGGLLCLCCGCAFVPLKSWSPSIVLRLLPLRRDERPGLSVLPPVFPSRRSPSQFPSVSASSFASRLLVVSFTPVAFAAIVFAGVVWS